MQEAGTVIHLARSGRLILRSNISTIREGSILVDDNGKKSCKVLEIIGPVSNPFISGQPLTDRIERLKGKKLFLSDDLEGTRNRMPSLRSRDQRVRKFNAERHK